MISFFSIKVSAADTLMESNKQEVVVLRLAQILVLVPFGGKFTCNRLRILKIKPKYIH